MTGICVPMSLLESTFNQVCGNIGTTSVHTIRHSALLMTAAGSQSKGTFD